MELRLQKKKKRVTHIVQTYFYPFFNNIEIKKVNKNNRNRKRTNWISTLRNDFNTGENESSEILSCRHLPLFVTIIFFL